MWLPGACSRARRAPGIGSPAPVPRVRKTASASGACSAPKKSKPPVPPSRPSGSGAASSVFPAAPAGPEPVSGPSASSGSRDPPGPAADPSRAAGPDVRRAAVRGPTGRERGGACGGTTVAARLFDSRAAARCRTALRASASSASAACR